MISEIIFNIKNKKERTPEEKLLIQYWTSLAIISDVVLSYKKQDCSAEYALELIDTEVWEMLCK